MLLQPASTVASLPSGDETRNQAVHWSENRRAGDASGEPHSLEMLTPLVEKPHEAIRDLADLPVGTRRWLDQVVRVADVPIGAQSQH